MKLKEIRELMLPLSDYAVVSHKATLVEALEALKSALERIQADRLPPRAVLVIDENNKIVGQMGHLDFLRALEPKYNMFGDLNALSRAGLSPDFIKSMMENYSILQSNLVNICKGAMTVKVKDIMRPVTQSIDENAPITEAIHRMVMWQSMRILVTRQSEVVGILRLADLFNEVSNCIDSIKQEQIRK